MSELPTSKVEGTGPPYNPTGPSSRLSVAEEPSGAGRSLPQIQPGATKIGRRWMRTAIRKAATSYKACALLCLNTIVLFALLNFAIFAAFRLKDGVGLIGRPRPSNHVVRLFGMPALRQVYPSYSDDDIRQLLQESWDRGLDYDPYTQYKERTYAGKFVNVSNPRLRLSKNNGPWPPDPKNQNIFLLGGSTTFGYGVADDQTIASHLQQFLDGKSPRTVKVYNFGSGCFASSQERTRFINLLAQGVVPDVAVFFDGLNDFLMNSGEPLFTDSLEKLWNDRDRSGVVRGMLAQLPIQRLLDSINSRIALQQQGIGGPTNDSLVASVLKRYSHNKRLIEAAARAYEVRTAFVWQPVPSYRYHLRHYLSDPQKDWLQSLTKNGYTAMSGIVKDNPKDYAQNFLWLADIQENSTESLYVDSFHYTDRFSNEIAVHIGQFLLERNLVTQGSARAQPLQSNRASSKGREDDWKVPQRFSLR
jgi:hypothetical protein